MPIDAANSPHIPSVQLGMLSLNEHLQADKSFLSCYARCLVAIALADKSVSLADFSELMEIARNAQYSALMGMQILYALEHGASLESCFAELTQAPRNETEAQAAFKIALPLLQLQGYQARRLAAGLAQALRIQANAADLDALPEEAQFGLMNNLASKARQFFRGKELADVVLDVGKSMGDTEIIQHARSCQSGLLSPQELNLQLNLALSKTHQNIAEYRQVLDNTLTKPAAAVDLNLPSRQRVTAGVQSGPAITLMQAAQQLQQQLEQRLSILTARIAHEKKCFAEDIDDLVHDAGNAIEQSISERLQTDKWRDKDVWASIAKTQFGMQAERRIGRAVQRREEVLCLFKEELRLFQADLQVVQASLLARQHHSDLAKLVPPLRFGTRVVNAMDTAANVTIGAGGVAVAGTGAAVYLLGSAAVLPLLAPAAPFLLGALAAAGVFKWFTDGDKRKIAEIAAKRKVIEDVVRARLHEAYLSFESQLDALEQTYFATAAAMLNPILLDAQAAEQVQAMHADVASKIIRHTESTMEKLALELR